MRTRILLMGLLLAAVANAQTIYHDASAFPLLGKATESTLTRYERLPDSLQNISRKPLWDLGSLRTKIGTIDLGQFGTPPFQLYKHFCQMGSKEQYEYEPHDTDRH